MKTLTLSDQHGPVAQSDPVKQSQTSTNQKKWGKRAWDRTEKIAVRCFWGVASVSMLIMLVGFIRVFTFGQDCNFYLQWYDKPVVWVLTQIMSESPTIDPDSVCSLDGID
jgi:hypothetical protein